jgi:acetyl esterase/lipase
MGLKKFLIVSAILMATFSYWIYDPLPPGYSSSSRRQFQVMSGMLKVTKFVSRVGSYLGFGSHAQLWRDIGEGMQKYMPKDDRLVLPGVDSSDTIFDGVPVRVYRPSDALNETLPAIVFYHGGGWTLGNIEGAEPISKRLCKETRTVVVSVEYRLAPEFPFPAAIDDCTTATKYFLKNAADFNADPKRVAVAGDSAGGNLAAAVSLSLRDEKFPIRIKLQVLIYPAVQFLDFNLPSMIQNKGGPILTRDMMTFFTAMYIDGNHDHENAYLDNRHVTKSFRQTIAKTYMNVEKLPKEFLSGYVKPDYPDGDEKLWNEVKGKMLNPYNSPLTADNFENLPDAYIFTANYDVLRDEGWLYAIKLKEAKNKVTIYNAEIGFHGIISFIGLFPEAELMFAEIKKFILDNL